MTTFGQLVARARRHKMLTLEKVAKSVGSHKGYISGIENGKVNPPSIRVIRRLCEALDLDFKAMAIQAWVEKAPREIRGDLVNRLYHQ